MAIIMMMMKAKMVITMVVLVIMTDDDIMIFLGGQAVSTYSLNEPGKEKQGNENQLNIQLVF